MTYRRTPKPPSLADATGEELDAPGPPPVRVNGAAKHGLKRATLAVNASADDTLVVTCPNCFAQLLTDAKRFSVRCLVCRTELRWV